VVRSSGDAPPNAIASRISNLIRAIPELWNGQSGIWRVDAKSTLRRMIPWEHACMSPISDDTASDELKSGRPHWVTVNG